MTKRSLSDLKIRAKPAISDERLIEIAAEKSPDASYTLALKETGNEEKAKACRFLAIARRDYGEEGFLKITGKTK